MITVGLCGRSGSGKSTVASLFQSLGFPVIDTDDLYHKILAEKGDCLKELAGAFGDEILFPGGDVDRRALARCVFMSEDRERRVKLLNAITHKYVLERVQALLHAYRDRGERAAFVDVPLLFESGFDKLCDVVVSVIADDDVLLSRLSARDGISKDEIRARIATQTSDDYLIAHSDYVIRNDGSLDSLYDQVQKMIDTRVFNPK